VNGKLHGIEKDYYESGALQLETPRVNDSIYGIAKTYYESGTLHWETPYVNGDRHGVAKSYGKDNINIVCLTLYKRDRGVLVLRLESYSVLKATEDQL
jgi:antitoxin component YwqK of YwqJK toxin-antitoxin module